VATVLGETKPQIGYLAENEREREKERVKERKRER